MLPVSGESVAKYIRQPSPYNTEIVALGVDTYLKMLLADNFVVRSRIFRLVCQAVPHGVHGVNCHPVRPPSWP